MAYNLINDARGEILDPLGASDTTVTIKDGKGARFGTSFPYKVSIKQRDESGIVTKQEIAQVTNRVADTFTIVRAVEQCPLNDNSTDLQQTAQAFSSGAEFSMAITAEIADQINNKVDNTTYNQEKTVYAATTTGNDDYAITATGVTGYVAGQTFKVQADVGNTGPATLNVNGQGAKAIEKLDGAFVPLDTGDIIANQIFWVTYNSAEDVFQFSVDPATAVVPAVSAIVSNRLVAETITKNDLVTAATETFETFASVDVDYIKAVKLDATRILICYEEVGVGGKALVATIGTTVTFGTAVQFTSENISALSVCTYDTDRALILFGEISSPSTGKAIVASITGATVSFGTETEINSGITNSVSCTGVSTTSVLAVYSDNSNSNYGTAQVLTISGTTITTNTEYVFSSNNITSISVDLISSNKCVIAFENNTAVQSSAVIASVSGTTLSFGGGSTATSGVNIGDVGVTKVGTDKFFMTIEDSTNNLLKGRVATVSGTTITFGTLTTIANTKASRTSIDSDKVDNVKISYWDITGGNSKYFEVLISGTTPTSGSETEFYSGGAREIAMVAMGADVFIGFEDFGTKYGEVAFFGGLGSVVKATDSSSFYVGFATSAITSGSSGDIAVSGLATGFSGLTVGSPYYATSTPGQISTTPSGNPIGRAISSTEILINPGAF